MKRLLIVLLLLLVLALPGGIALAQDEHDRVVESGQTVNNGITLFEGDLTVKDGATINGDVFLATGDITVADGATVNGAITLLGGNANISGAVDGDVVLFDGDLVAADSAVIHGDCVLLGGDVQGREVPRLNCNVVDGPSFRNFAPRIPEIPGIPTAPGMPPDVDVSHRNGGGVLGNVFGAIIRSLFLGVLAFVVATIAPRQMGQVEDTIRQKPVASGAVGLLTAVAVPSVAAILAFVSALLTLVCIGILGFPIVFALLVGLGIAALFGWVAVGHMVGQKLTGWLCWKGQSVPVTAAIGTLTLTLLLGLLQAIPFFLGEGLISTLLLCVGLGAAALTQFGTRPYPVATVVENSVKVSAVLDTLPDDPTHLKG